MSLDTEPVQGWTVIRPYWHGKGSFIMASRVSYSRRDAHDKALDDYRFRMNEAGVGPSRRARLAWLNRNGYRAIKVRVEPGASEFDRMASIVRDFESLDDAGRNRVLSKLPTVRKAVESTKPERV